MLLIIILCILLSVSLVCIGQAQRKKRSAAMRQRQLEECRRNRILQRAPRETTDVHFAVRPAGTLVCPLCDTRQRSDRVVCYQCGARFLYNGRPEEEVRG